MSRDKLSHITGDTMKTALDGFSLKFADGWNYEILAVEVKNALFRTIPPERLDPSRLSNDDIRDKLSKLSQATRALDSEISSIYSLADDRLKDASFKNDGFTNFIAFIFSESNQYFRFHKVVSEFSFLADFLLTAANNTERQSHKWRELEKQRIRIWQAETLIPIFTSASGKKATVNNARTADEWENPTSFMIFYQRMVGLAFGENGTPNLPEVLKTARRNYDKR